MDSLWKWQAWNALIAAKFDAAEAAFKQAQSELATLKHESQPNQALGLQAAYAHLESSFDNALRTDAILERFGRRLLPIRSLADFLYAIVVTGLHQEPRSTETRAGQLSGIFVDAQRTLEALQPAHHLMERQIEERFTSLRNVQKFLESQLQNERIRAMAAELVLAEMASAITEGLREELGERLGHTALEEALAGVAEERAELVAAQGIFDRLFWELMAGMAEVGIKMARQRLMTEFVRGGGIQPYNPQRRGGAEDVLRRHARKLRQGKITDFFGSCEG